jgi:RNA polymerase sigma-70 factor (ECF subfamily)
MSDAQSEVQLLADLRAARQGDGVAYARIIRRCQPPLARRMMHFARGKMAVEELVHEVFVEAYFSLPKFRGDAPFEHWLQRIATRVGYRYWKQQQKRWKVVEGSLELVEHVAAVDSNSEIDAREAAETLAVLLEHLPPRDRLVITLLHVEGRNVEETAKLAGWSRTMVKVQAHRARAKLKRLLLTRETALAGSKAAQYE